MLSDRQFSRAAKLLNKTGGLSIHGNTGSVPTRGWMVATSSDTDLESLPEQPTAEDIKGFQQRHAGAVKGAGYIGAWNDPQTGEGEIEPSKRFRDTSRGFTAAARTMTQANQKAMYNPGNGRMYWNSKHPDLKEGFLGSEAEQENRVTNAAWAKNQLKKKYPKLHREAFGKGG